ncbi:hypothetical protein [Bradyrhizobium sp. BWC-3-1]|uniref:hypothetical protein n=1 Tax=Bradyrhizobium sp. BWC-3-1 TaxID=3080012 RepID=UPI00293EFF5C|nr:hypothetical protein [Bradyrhizobium sp. BWC-3-1]WOH57617.1 hypothetical protein RX329_36455 [Bradyrhizobium sp. BWC-3-1]
MAKTFAYVEAIGESKAAEWLALLLEREASLRHDLQLALHLRLRPAIPFCSFQESTARMKT